MLNLILSPSTDSCKHLRHNQKIFLILKFPNPDSVYCLLKISTDLQFDVTPLLGQYLLDDLLTVFTALFPILASTSGSERLAGPPSPGKLRVGVAGDLQQVCLETHLSGGWQLRNIITTSQI